MPHDITLWFRQITSWISRRIWKRPVVTGLTRGQGRNSILIRFFKFINSTVFVFRKKWSSGRNTGMLGRFTNGRARFVAANSRIISVWNFTYRIRANNPETIVLTTIAEYWKFEFLEIWLFGNLNLWKSEFLEIWIFGNLNFLEIYMFINLYFWNLYFWKF